MSGRSAHGRDDATVASIVISSAQQELADIDLRGDSSKET